MARCEVRSTGRGWALTGVCVVLTSILGPPPLSAQEVNLDSRVRVQFGGVRYHRAEQLFVTSGTLTNISSDVLLEPMSLVLTSVSPGVILANSSGQTGDGLPFVSVPLPDGFLGPGGRVQNLVLKFKNPSGAAAIAAMAIRGRWVSGSSPVRSTRSSKSSASRPTSGGVGWRTKRVGRCRRRRLRAPGLSPRRSWRGSGESSTSSRTPRRRDERTRMNQRLGWVTLGLLAVLVASAPAAAQTGTTRYVNSTDPTCGGHSPCYATIQAAVTAARAADTIQIQAGSYVEQVAITGKNIAGATEGSRIIIQADPAAAVGSVVLHGAITQCTNGFAIQLQQSKFITIRGLTITGAGGQAISLLGGNNQNQAIRIERNRIVGNGSPSCDGGITIAGGNPDTLIVNNLIYANGGNGLATIDADGGPHDIIGNTIHGNGWSGVNITRNHQVFLVNNAITGNGTPGSIRGFGVVREASTTPDPAGIHLLNNLICGNQMGEISGPALDATDSGNLTPTGTEGPGVAASLGCDNAATVYKQLAGADGLLGTSDDDFTLATGSPAIDRGMDARTLGLPTAFTPLLEADFAGTAARPKNGTGAPTTLFDMGALEATVPDTQAPTVSFLQPAVNAHLRQTVTVQAQATDAGSGVASLSLRADSQGLTATLSPTVPPPAASVTATASWNTITVADGTHTLTATATDQATNPATAQRVVIVDNTPPQVQITDGPSGQNPNTTATFTFTGTDNLTPVASLGFAWRLDGGAFTSSSSTTATFSGLADGLHLFEVKARDLAGNETAPPASRSFTASALSLQVTSPPAGATVQAGLLLVRGSVSAGGADVGVTVNGRPAVVYGNAFTALVTVDQGTTQLIAVATTVTGATTSSTIPIGVTGTPSNAVVLRPNPESGIAPLQVTFSVSSPRPLTQVALDFDGNGSVDFQGASLDGQPFTYTQPGLYVASVVVTDSKGTQTNAAAVIQVLDRARLDALLQSKWIALRDALSRADVAGAVGLFAQASRNAYQDQLGALAGVGALGQVASDLGPIRLVRTRVNAAEYEVRAIRNAVEYSFHVLFVVDGDGVWRLRAF